MCLFRGALVVGKVFYDEVAKLLGVFMEVESIAFLLALLLWLVPAFLLTIKVEKMKKISDDMKWRLIIPLWVVPLVGNLVCYMIFANTGKLPVMAEGERKRYWR